MPDTAEAPQAAPPDQPASSGILPEWGQVQDRFTRAYPNVPPEEIQRTYDGVRNVSLWRARLADSQETTGSWLYRRSLPVASAQLNIRNAGYVDEARRKILNGEGTPEDAEVIAVQNRLAEADANAGTGERIAGGLASIPAIVGEAFVGGRVLRPIMGLFGGAVAGAAGSEAAGVAGLLSGPSATSAATSALRPIASRFAQGAATSPLMPSLYAQQAINNNREAGRSSNDWRGFPSALTMAAIQNGVFSSVGSLTGSAPTGPGALDTARRVFAQGVNAMAVQQGMDIATSAIDDVGQEIFGQSLNMSTRYGILGHLWRGEQGEALQDAVTQAVTMFAFAAFHETGNRPRRGPYDLRGRELAPIGPEPRSPNGTLQEPIQWLGQPNEPTSGGPLTRRWPVAEGMRATRSFLNDLSSQGRSAPEAAAELNRVMTIVDNIVTNAREQGISREQARQRIIDTLPEGKTRDYGLRVIDLVPLGETQAAPEGAPEARQGVRTPETTPKPLSPTESPQRTPVEPQRAAVTMEQLAAIGKPLGLSANGVKKAMDSGNQGVMAAVEAAYGQPAAERPTSFAGYPNAPESPPRPLRERMMERGRSVSLAPPVQPLEPLAPHRELREPPLAKATSTAEVQRVLQEAPGFESPAAMFTAQKVSPIEQAVLKERFADDYPSFATTAERLAAMGFTSPRGGPYASQRMKQIEQLALAKLGAKESVHSAIAASRKQSVAEASIDQADAIVEAGMKGEVTIVKAATQLQDLLDKVQNERDRLADQTTAKVNQAKAEGKTQAEIDAIMAKFNEEMANVEKRARNASRQNRGPARGSQPSQEPVVISPGSRQNQVEAEPRPAPTGPAAPANPVSPVQSAAVPGRGQAVAAPKLTFDQVRSLRGVKGPAKQFLLDNFARANNQARTLYDAIVKVGGLKPESVTAYGLDLKKMKEDFPPGLFAKKGGIAVEELVGGSEIGRQIWGDRAETEADKQHRGDDLFAKLANHYLLEPGNWFENERYQADLQNIQEAVHEDLRGRGLTGQALEAAVNAKVAQVLSGADRIADQAAAQPDEPGDAFEDEWAPRLDPRQLSQFLADFHGDESGHLDLDVLRDFASQYGIEPARGMIAHVNGVWRQLAGEGSPHTTDANRAAGEALERFNGSDIYARFVAPVLTEKVLAGDQSPEFQELLGGTLTERRFRWMRKVYNDMALAASADLQKAIVERDAADAAQKQAEAQAAMHRRNGMPKAAATSEAYARTFAKARAEADQSAREASARSAEAIKARNGVPSLIGLPDSPFATFADYKNAMQNQNVADAIKRHERFVVPVMEDAFRRSKGMDPADPINSPTQIPGSPVNLKSAKAGDKDVESVIWTKGVPAAPGEAVGGTQRAGRPPNVKLRRNRYTRQATGTAEGYDISYGKMVEASLVHQLTNAAKAEAVRAGVDAGLYKWGKPGQSVGFEGEQARWGQEFNDVKPPKGTQAALAGETSLYVHPDMAHEFRRAIEIDEPLKFKTIEKFMGAIMAVNLASTAELTYHAKNQLGFLMRTGFNPVSLFHDIVGVVKREPRIMDELVELARINTMKTEGFETGSIINKGKYNPLNWGGTLLDLTRKVLLLQGNRAYDRMVKAGLTNASETGRRNFLNQLGNYNKRSQHKLIKFLRDTQIGPFATAGFNYLVQGVRSVTMNPGVKPASMEARLRLRAGMLLRTVAVLAAVELLNKAIWGRLDASDDTPLGAVRTGTSQGGTSQYVDLMDLIGLKRGLRVLGLLSLIEGKRRNALPEKIIDRSARDMVTALVHPLAGPGAQFGLTAAYGVDASGFHVAERASQLRHESQAALNLKAAAEHANPAFGTLFGHSQQRKPVGQRVMELAGPFGVHTAPPRR